MEYYGNNDWRDYISHHGIEGQRWGIRNGPPYPLEKGKYDDKLKGYKTLSQNLNSWGDSPNTNVLYISGKSGSGKSTLALKLKDSNTEIINLDSYFDNPDGPKSKDFNRYLDRHNSEYRKLSLPKDKISLNDWGKVCEKFEKEIEDYGRDAYKRDKKVIVEGVQLLDDTVRPDKTYFQDKPVILVQTNTITSIYRGNKRDEKPFEFRDIKNSMAWNKDIRNFMKENDLRKEG